MTKTMWMDDMFFEFPRRDKFIGAEGLPGRVWNDLQLTVAVDVPSASGLNVSDIVSNHQLLPGSHAPTKFVFAGIFAPAQRIAPITAGNEIQVTIAIDIHRDHGKLVVVIPVAGQLVGDDKFLAKLRPAIPEATCDDIGHAISIDIENADSFECLCGYELA